MIEARTISPTHPTGATQLHTDNGLPPDVHAFCQQHGCVDAVRRAIHIAVDCFDATGIVLSLQTDPVTREDWIEFAVDAVGDVPQLMEAEHRFTLRLHDEIPAPARNLLRLCLTSADD